MSTALFKTFAQMLAAHFVSMSTSELYRTAIDGDRLWELYLASFPDGTNPIYRKRTEHDGSYDRAFIRKIGNVVRINDDGSLTTIWDIANLPAPYATVASILATAVRQAELDTLFRIKECTLGVMRNVEQKDGVTTEFNHFYTSVARKHCTARAAEEVGDFNTTCAVIRRGFTEITPDAVDTVLDLIEQNTLYRGAEFKDGLLGFRTSQMRFLDAPDDQARMAVVYQAFGTPGARIRNSAIGTLLQDLSAGTYVEVAVSIFERMVAPTNYKRPTALVTPKMIELAVATIRGLGLESALERRFAVIGDLSVNNVLWVDNSVQAQMKDGLTDLLMSAAKPSKISKLNEQISIDDFMANVLPKAAGLELLFTNDKQANLMSLTAPVHADAGSLFKWGNNFAWSYNGNITDSIKEKVKAAGGNTDAKLRVSLAWFNHDDLDLHANCPEGHVYYGQKYGQYGGVYRSSGGPNGQILDVDMNAGGGTTRTPVENLSWREPKDGVYEIMVDQFAKRETDKVGFVLEVENDGKITQLSYHKAMTLRQGLMLRFTIKAQKIVDLKVMNSDLIGQGIAQQKWGVTTEQFVKVNTVLNSPNHWDGEHTGHKHVFFILDGCKNDEPTRGIYNEFLKPELEQHRKVFEVLGNKTKCLPSNEQLSGLGFSTTKRDSVIVKVMGQTINQIYQINF